jgi:hypothetical protein
MPLRHNDPVARRFACTDCGRFGLGFMLLDRIWDLAARSRSILLCIRCVEVRLGRRLEIADFADVPVNLPLFHLLGIGRS